MAQSYSLKSFMTFFFKLLKTLNDFGKKNQKVYALRNDYNDNLSTVRKIQTHAKGVGQRNLYSGLTKILSDRAFCMLGLSITKNLALFLLKLTYESFEKLQECGYVLLL